jgi:hypothetical protein
LVGPQELLVVVGMDEDAVCPEEHFDELPGHMAQVAGDPDGESGPALLDQPREGIDRVVGDGPAPEGEVTNGEGQVRRGRQPADPGDRRAGPEEPAGVVARDDRDAVAKGMVLETAGMSAVLVCEDDGVDRERVESDGR